MDALGNGGFWWRFPPRGRRFRSKSSSDSISGQGGGSVSGHFFDFPLKQAATAASLTLTGDTIAQVRDRWISPRGGGPDMANQDVKSVLWSNYDWLRALRMASYGFLLYGPGSYAWYQFLDHSMPKQTFANLSLKVSLNQIVLGPCVITVVFAWNNLWQKKLSQLPMKYQKDALPTLLYGFRFWIPVSILNFWAVPLPARVGFMSTCSIFWNFYLSTTMNK